MSDHNDGGPAFPFSPNDHSTARMVTNGMSLRDYFAGRAMAALIAINGAHSHATQAEVDACRLALAARAYGFSDAMLAARNSTTTKGA